ncbi:hypothetical protein E0L36_09600 [Streptomyces sp. AJS327]|uniref:hypothetical protein n=1 Tax=Streptomyces sp. AJS327 TaxID=2545265 RepID=UPI0015DF5EF6|nr:hypothetical protein [Streptomyces sp. AJS327]MBA0051137.1 hypothetical protein [Streptomyces sp. AJS327]
MWPGQQQPGGEQNPQQPNPYQQPGYQQPNPYQQPGYQQPGPDQNPYQQPGGWGAPTVPGQPQGPQGGGGKSKKTTTIIAIAAAVVVIAGSVVTGAVLMSDDDGEKDKADDKQSNEPQGGDGGKKPSGGDGGKGGEDPSPEPSESKDPKEPTIKGWQAVTNPKHYSTFDVPGDWKVATSGTYVGWGEKKPKNGGFPTAQVTMSAPAFNKEDWCGENSSMAAVGTKGAQGAKNTKEATEPQADSFAYFAYGEEKDTIKRAKAKPFKNKHGIKGHIAVAKAVGVKKKDKCDTDGQVVAVSWLNANDDLATFLMVANTGVKGAVSNDTIMKIISTLRSSGTPGEDDNPRG